MNRSENALKCFREGFNCAQAVLSAYAAEFGLEYETALRVSGAFGAGMGGTAQTCGAVTGALMVIGLKYGKIKADDNTTKEKAYALVKEFMEKFSGRNGSINCKKILGIDISVQGGLQRAKDNSLFSTKCSPCVASAVEILGEII